MAPKIRNQSTTAPAVPPVYLWNPTEFDPMSYVDEPRRADLARFLMHRVHYADVFKLRDRDGFVYLKAKYLRRFFPRNEHYKPTRDCLIDRGALVCDGRSIEGEKSYGYKLGPEYANMRHHRVEVTDMTLAKKIRADRDDRTRAPDAVHRHLVDYLHRVEIDDEAASARALARTPFEPTDLTAVEMLRDGVIHWNVCPYGRFHSNLTNLRSGLRAFLSYRGWSLVNLDIRNSQPLIFALLLREHFGEAGPMPEDVERYIELVQAGQLYDHLMAQGNVPQERRSEFKREFFRLVFFSRNERDSDEARMFAEQFPAVHEVVRVWKAGAGPKPHAALSHRLQLAESEVMIGGVARRCMQGLPRAFIATIHDSILTTPDQAEAIKAIMLDEFGRRGLRPTIRLEPLDRIPPDP